MSKGAGSVVRIPNDLLRMHSQDVLTRRESSRMSMGWADTCIAFSSYPHIHICMHIFQLDTRGSEDKAWITSEVHFVFSIVHSTLGTQ